MEQFGYQWTDFHEIYHVDIFSKMRRGSLTRTTGTLHENQYAYLMISNLVLLRMKNVSDKFVEKIKIHISCFNNFMKILLL